MKEEIYLKNGGSVVVNDTVDKQGRNAREYELVTQNGYLVKLNEDGEVISREKLEEKDPGFEHFFAMDEEKQMLVRSWYYGTYMSGFSEEKRVFLEKVKKALEKVKGLYYIASIEPSIDRTGKLYYKPGDPVATNLRLFDWKEKAENFSRARNSRIASEDELYLWYAYRVAVGYWDLDYLCEQGLQFRSLEKSAKQEIGGFADGIFNTARIVLDEEQFWYKVFGRSIIENAVCIANLSSPLEQSIAVVVLD